MAINVSQAFHRTSANPVDESMALTKAQMKTVNDNLMPAYYFTICQDDGGIYLYDKSATASEETGKFRKFEGGGSGEGGSIFNATLTAAGWDSSTNSQEVTFTGYQTTMGGVVGMPTTATSAQKAAYKESKVTVIGQNNNKFTFKCENIPEIDLPVTLYAGGGSGSGGGDSTLTADVTSNITVGAIPSGTTIPEGTTFTEFVQKLLISEIAPTVTFSASGSGIKEVGTSVAPTLTLTISNNGTGTPTAIKFYSGTTLLDTKTYVSGTTSYSYTMTSAITENTTVKGVLEYKKSDDSTANITKTSDYIFVMASYYGAVTNAPTTKTEVTALTKNVKNTKAQTATFNLSNQRSCYCYPASFGNLTSIKDANNFEYLSSYTKTTVEVDGTNYNVYTLTDPVTATGFKQVYA
jgi:hypothetical protein